MPRLWLFSCALLIGLRVVAQDPPLSPTVSTVIDVDPTFGELRYSSITIPAGVTVSFTGLYPVRIRVQGDVRIDGALVLPPGVAPPLLSSTPNLGSVMTGRGSLNIYSWVYGYYELQWPTNVWVPGYYSSGTPATPGRHATVYGTAIPFDLAGGSPGGGVWYQDYFNWVNPSEHGWGAYYPGGGGGGTLVLEAAGRIDVLGSILADGGVATYPQAQPGSGGSILLRGLHGCNVAVGATVSAMPEGIIRLDAYDQAPQIAGSVQPSPTVVRLPDLAETLPPTIGNPWQLRVVAPRGDVLFLAASVQPGSTTTAYGTLGIGLSTAITFAFVAMPANGHDPLATCEVNVPNTPQLIGLPLWVQGLDWFTSLPQRYTQTLHTTVR